ncbi:MAG: hypothetical protein HY940_07460 [Gammaproteobacteria bacterium]|nr:hypothetical protein [Gammaproteobacteria bacterium]
MAKWLVAVMLMGAISAASGGELNLILNGKAVHLNKSPYTTKKLNEKNWGLGIQYDMPLERDPLWRPFMAVSGFEDSMYNPSYYAGGGMMRRFHVSGTHNIMPNIDVGLVAFLMTREDYKDNNPFPGLLPVASFGNDRVALNITYIPKVHPKLMALWFFQLKVGMGKLTQ